LGSDKKMSQTEVLQKPTPRDMDILRTIQLNLKLDRQTTFSANDIHNLKLDRFFKDPSSQIGGWFARQQHAGNIRQVGFTRSDREGRHLARICKYEITWRTSDE
jgi:hypothetical protein